uniref:Uncharacterized protein n=1 Tax=Bactrocera dorsalis TaxID=27457 RepID=A0A034VEY5_BACDO
MAIRLLRVGALRHLWYTSNKVSQEFRHNECLKLKYSIYSLFEESKCVRKLHIKTYDKDAGLEEQRQANKKQQTLPDHEPFRNENTSKEDNLNRHIDHFVEKLNDADIFGNNQTTEIKEDAGDVMEDEYTNNPKSRTLRTIDYARLIKSHLAEKRLKDAIAVLEVHVKARSRQT